MSDAPPTDPRSLAVPGAEIVVRVTPNASREQVTLDGSRFVIRVTCVPEDGKANKAVTKLLGKTSTNINEVWRVGVHTHTHVRAQKVTFSQ